MARALFVCQEWISRQNWLPTFDLGTMARITIVRPPSEKKPSARPLPSCLVLSSKHCDGRAAHSRGRRAAGAATASRCMYYDCYKYSVVHLCMYMYIRPSLPTLFVLCDRDAGTPCDVGTLGTLRFPTAHSPALLSRFLSSSPLRLLFSLSPFQSEHDHVYY